MAPPSSLPDSHGDDVLDLIARLMAIEFERGKLMAQLEFHLQVRTMAVAHAEEDRVEEQAKPRKKPGRPEGSVKRKPGELQREIIEDLSKCGALDTRHIAHHVSASEESVRQTLRKLIDQAKVERAGRKKFRLSRTNHEPPTPDTPPEEASPEED